MKSAQVSLDIVGVDIIIDIEIILLYEEQYLYLVCRSSLQVITHTTFYTCNILFVVRITNTNLWRQ
jgi:hypothetical protein